VLMLVLIVAVAACLAVGLFLGKMLLVWCALGASVLGVLLLGYVLYAGRRSGGTAPGADGDATVELPAGSGEPLAEGSPAVAVTAEPTEPADESTAVADEPTGRAEPASVTDQPTGRAEPAAVTDEPTEPAEPTAVTDEPASTPAPAEAPASPVEAGAGRPDLAGTDRVVHVLPGRRRFHMDGCRLVAGKPAEEISLDEAREEGFTACTSCIPDREALLSPR
jgi:hypothetical protein